MNHITVTGEASIDCVLTKIRQAALQGALVVAQLDLPGNTFLFVVVTQPVTSMPEPTEVLFGQATHTDDSGRDLVHWVSEAFRQYENPALLAQNGLVRLLDLSQFVDRRDAPAIAMGKALQRAMDSVINALEEYGTARAVRLVEVFRERFTYGGKHQTEVAAQRGCNPVTIRRAELRLAWHIAREFQHLKRNS